MARLRRPAVLVLVAVLVVFALLAAGSLAAQPPGEGAYRMPDKVLVDLADAPQTPRVLADPRHRWLLALTPAGLPPIRELAQRELRLAGLRIDPQTHGASRRPYATAMQLIELSNGETRPVAGLPAAPRIGGVSWSPDGSYLAFTLLGTDRAELWVVDPQRATARRVSDARLNLVLDPAPHWLADSRTLLCALVPEGRGAEPAPPPVPPGPVTQETAGRAAPARTYQDLLKSPYDEALFEYYLTVQLARIDLDGKVTPLGKPGLHRASPSPDGRYLLVETYHRPYSYLVPLERFARRVEIWQSAGAGTPVREVVDLPLREEVPIAFDSVPAGPRAFQWRADVAATLSWVEALDGGDSTRKAELRDRVLTLAAPFAGEPTPLVSLGYRLAGIDWGRGDLALVSEVWWKTRRERTWVIRPESPATPPAPLFDRSSEDRFGDPGEPLKATNAYGRPVLLTQGAGRVLYFTGAGASKEGDRPFLDVLDLDAQPRQARRLFRSAAPLYEQPVELLEAGGTHLLVRRESVTEPPNYFVLDLTTGTARPVTRFANPVPQLAGVQKEILHYRRADGVELSATLYLPAGHRPADGPLPLLLWAYPREFKSAEAAGQVTPSPYRFERVGWYSPMIWVLRGYAVLDDPGMPIVGAGESEPNDTYVQQLVSDAQAAIDEVVRKGVADRDHLAVAGHSYGAFMAANLLAHSRLFATGIAMSGAYNRTLTPFGFQAEERTLWQAPRVYDTMSPFQNADKVKAPILLVHGQADNNPGTDPVQSERFYNALKGLGGTARLALLPYESHSYRGRESILHLLWEMDTWLDAKLKKAAPKAAAPSP